MEIILSEINHCHYEYDKDSLKIIFIEILNFKINPLNHFFTIASTVIHI